MGLFVGIAQEYTSILETGLIYTDLYIERARVKRVVIFSARTNFKPSWLLYSIMGVPLQFYQDTTSPDPSLIYIHNSARTAGRLGSIERLQQLQGLLRNEGSNSRTDSGLHSSFLRIGAIGREIDGLMLLAYFQIFQMMGSFRQTH
jgi:hypothetical protein